MTPLEDELAGLAGEYVLGLLAGEERDRFERRMSSDTRLRGLVETWQRWLQPLAEHVEPVAPAPLVWQRIEASLEAPSALRQQRQPRRQIRRLRWWERVGFWRGWSLGATALAAALAMFIVLRPQPQPAPRLLAVLNATGGQPGVLFSVPATGNAFTARAVQTIAATPLAHELWLLPRGSAAPISLGLLAPDAPTRRPLAPQVAPLVKPGAAVAVSEEPPGGSPTGQPTGPVVYVGTLIEDQG